MKTNDFLKRLMLPEDPICPKDTVMTTLEKLKHQTILVLLADSDALFPYE